MKELLMEGVIINAKELNKRYDYSTTKRVR